VSQPASRQAGRGRQSCPRRLARLHPVPDTLARLSARGIAPGHGIAGQSRQERRGAARRLGARAARFGPGSAAVRRRGRSAQRPPRRRAARDRRDHPYLSRQLFSSQYPTRGRPRELAGLARFPRVPDQSDVGNRPQSLHRQMAQGGRRTTAPRQTQDGRRRTPGPGRKFDPPIA